MPPKSADFARSRRRGSHRDPDDAAADRVAGHWSAESVHLVERLVVAPVAGVFFPTFTEVSPDEPGVVAAGDQIGFVVHCGDKQIVDSPFTGRLLGLLAHPGERVRPEQPLAWLTTADDW